MTEKQHMHVHTNGPISVSDKMTNAIFDSLCKGNQIRNIEITDKFTSMFFPCHPHIFIGKSRDELALILPT